MFRHKDVKNDDSRTESQIDDKIEKVETDSLEKNDVAETTPKEEIKELLEKNLKWSQIIYEQNRRINRKLLWTAIAGWLRLLLILIPLVLALLFLPTILNNVWSQYGELLGVGKNTSSTSVGSLNELMKLLNFSSEQKEQLKTIVK